MAGNDRNIFRTKEGMWANKRQGASKAASLHSTQRKAEDAGRDMLRKSGGGELITHGLDGKIRSKDTIAKPDPNPPKDQEH